MKTATKAQRKLIKANIKRYFAHLTPREKKALAKATKRRYYDSFVRDTIANWPHPQKLHLTRGVDYVIE